MAANTREIITLQVGHYANFIGTHWWNLQESSFNFDPTKTTDINHDYLFQRGISPIKEETYTPRLLIIDAKNSLGSLSPYGTLYEPPSLAPSTAEALWDGDVQLVNQLPDEKNKYLKYLESEEGKCVNDSADEGSPQMDLTPEVTVWSDFLRTNMHPNSISLLKDVSYHECENANGEGWGFQAGAAMYRKEDTENEIIDKIRHLAESSDSLQGFQLLSDVHNGMGGVSWKLSEHLDEEYHNKNLFTFLATPPFFHPTSMCNLNLYLSSVIQAYTAMSSVSSIVHPLSLINHSWDLSQNSQVWPYMSFMSEHPYHTSSILASYLDTITMAYRSRESFMSMNQFSSVLTPYNRKIVCGDFSFPIGLSESEFLDSWIANSDSHFRSVSGGCDSSDSLSVCQLVRGVPNEKLRSNSQSNLLRLPAWEHIKYLMEERTKTNNLYCFKIKDSLSCSMPYPQIFTKNVNSKGWIMNQGTSQSGVVEKCPAIAKMSQSSGMYEFLKEMYKRALRIKVNSNPRLLAEGVDDDSWKETLEEFKYLVNMQRNTTSFYDS